MSRKSPQQLDREIAEALASRGTARSPEWQSGFSFAKESAQHESRAEMREVYQRLHASARNDFDRGMVAGYAEALGDTPRSLAPLASSADIRAATKKGDRLDNFGQVWRVQRVTRTKITAVREHADHRDPEKIVLGEQRDFHPRDIAHMRKL